MSETNDGIAGCTADEALARLMAGNKRFISGRSHFTGQQREALEALAKGQQPYATILGCSDSRVPPEMVFDAGLGDLFIIRVAGNVLGPSINGTLQYAKFHLHTPLFVVLGHEGCGAVEAALASKFQGATHRAHISLLLQDIMPALEDLEPGLTPDALLSAAVLANVRHTTRALIESPEGSAGVAAGRIRVVGAIYDIKSGRVRLLDTESASPI